jgi:glycine oxidase
MQRNPDILVLGGGAIGLSIAYYLARAGARVSVFDKGALGQEASWAGAGIIPPGNPAKATSPLEQLRAHSAAMWPGLSAELREQTGLHNGYVCCGGIDFPGASNCDSAKEWQTEGVAVEELSSGSLSALEPRIAGGLAPAFHLPGMAQVRNPRHLKALAAACAAKGVELGCGFPFLGLEVHHNRVHSVRSSDGDRSAGNYIVAAGAWTDGILQPLGWRLGVKPVRGQIALLKTETPLFRHILLMGSRYLVPRPDGRVLAGSTEEDAGFDKRTTATAIAELLKLAIRLVPDLGSAPVERCWAGLRPGSPDGLPFLGKVPGLENLYVAAGHFRAGIQLSPITGLLVKELVLGEPLTLPLDPFRIDRQTAMLGAS